MSNAEIRRLEAEYAKAAREHNERVMELVGRQLDVARKAAKVAKKK